MCNYSHNKNIADEYTVKSKCCRKKSHSRLCIFISVFFALSVIVSAGFQNISVFSQAVNSILNDNAEFRTLSAHSDEESHDEWTSVNKVITITKDGNYYLTADISSSTSACVTVSAGVNATLCLNGHTVTRSYNSKYFNSCIVINSGATLTLEDCSQDSSGSITGKSYTKLLPYGCVGSGVYVNGGTFIINGGKITDCILQDTPTSAIGSVYLWSSHSLYSTSKVTFRGIGVFVSSGSFTMNGGSIENCYFKSTKVSNFHSYGSGISAINDSVVEINDGVVKNCGVETEKFNSSNSVCGGGISIEFSSLTINGGSVENCFLTLDESLSGNFLGAGIWCACSDFTMNGGSIKNNTISKLNGECGLGGGVSLWYCNSNAQNSEKTGISSVIMNAGEISGNSAGSGGGIYVDNDCTLQMYNALITDNTSAYYGGGIANCPYSGFCFYATDGGAIYDNSANYSTGGCYSNEIFIDLVYENNDYSVYLADNMLGGGKNNYSVTSYEYTKHSAYGQDDYEVSTVKTGLATKDILRDTLIGYAINNSGLDAGDLAAAKGAAQLYLSGNTAFGAYSWDDDYDPYESGGYMWSSDYGEGGAIFNNGSLTIGTYTASLEVTLEETTLSDYQIIPGTSQEKDPVVTIDNTTEAYVYVVVNDQTDGLVEYEIADGWEELDGYKNIYYRTASASGGIKSYSVLKDNRVYYSSELLNSNMVDENDNLKTDLTITFKAYAVETATFTDAEQAWKTVFENYVTNEE